MSNIENKSWTVSEELDYSQYLLKKYGIKQVFITDSEDTVDKVYADRWFDTDATELVWDHEDG